MNLKISYSREADKFLKRNVDTVTESDVEKLVGSAVRKILKFKEESNIDIKKLKGKYKGNYRIRESDIRIIFSLKKEDILVAFIKAIDFRGNIYK